MTPESTTIAERAETIPLVSVIIPTYNRREYVCQAIDSALAQTYPNIEIIVVDDGSTDGTCEILRQVYGDSILLEWQPNRGVSSARNRALSRAHGDYVAFLDSDDIWVQGKLTLQMDAISCHTEVGLVSGYVDTIDRDGTTIHAGPTEPWQVAERVRPEDIVLRSPLYLSTLLVRRSLIGEPRAFDPSLRYGEDLDLCLRVAAQANVAFVTRIITHMRYHPDSVTAQVQGAERVAEWLSQRTTVLRRNVPRLPLAADEGERLLQRAVAQELLDAAMGNYAAGLETLAESQVTDAIELDSQRWSDPSELEALARGRVARLARTEGYDAGIRYARVMTESLSRLITGYSKSARVALGNAHMAIVFLAHERGDRGRVIRHMALGLLRAPRWARSRGVRSIMAQALVGEQLAVRLKRELVRPTPVTRDDEQEQHA